MYSGFSPDTHTHNSVLLDNPYGSVNTSNILTNIQVNHDVH